MKRKKTLICVLSAFALSVSLVTVLSTKGVVNKAKVSDEVNATITFSANDTVKTKIDDNTYRYVTEGTFEHGSKLYAFFEGSANIDNVVAPLPQNGMVLFSNNPEGLIDYEKDLFKFQSVSQVSVTFKEETNGTFMMCHFRNASDNVPESFTALEIDNGTVEPFIPREEDRIFSIGNNMEGVLELTSVSFTYSCSYDYVEPDYSTKTIDIYASNDFHGYVKDDNTVEDNIGLKKFGTYFKRMGERDNTLLLDQGDTWQGGIYSNTNRGALVNDVMTAAHFDARTIGNHDFDWGTQALKNNTAREYDGYKIPVLAANVYDYNFSTKEFGDTQQSDIGAEYVTYTLENGLKVGIVGVIGSDQITSICTQFTMDISFKPHIQIIKDVATKLRNEEKCDVVICSIHAGQAAVRGEGLADYVDLVLCAHTHKDEHSEETNTAGTKTIGFHQFGSDGTEFGHIQLGYSPLSKTVYEANYERIYRNTIETELDGYIDPTINDLVDESMAACPEDPNEVLATGVSGTFNTKGEGPNLVARAVYDYATQVDGIDDIDFSYVNDTRYVLTSGTWTYENIYAALPFDNMVFVANIPGSDILTEVQNYNYVYAGSTFDGIIRTNRTYKVAVLDYLLLHTNSSRYFDYFPSVESMKVDELQCLSTTYRYMVKWWLKDYMHYDQLENNFTSDEFKDGVTRHNKGSWDWQKCTVTYDLNYQGGSASYHQSQVPYGGRATTNAPAEPSREGYFFEGWYGDSECTQRAADIRVYCDITLYAHWVEPSTLTFHKNYDGADPEVFEVVENTVIGRRVRDTYPELVPERPGYLFNGWYIDANCEITAENRLITGDMDIYAGWIEASNVRLHLNYGVIADEDDDLYTTTSCAKGNSLYYVFSNPYEFREDEGYFFAGWYFDRECTEPVTEDSYALNDTYELYAGWYKGTQVKFVLSADSVDDPYQTIYYKPEERFADRYYRFEEPSMAGKAFTGWYLDSECLTPADYETVGNEDTILYAGWSEALDVKFVYNYGEDEVYQTVSYESGTYYGSNYPANPSREGYNFTGWYLDSECTLLANDEIVSGEHLTLYAGWEEYDYLSFRTGQLNMYTFEVGTTSTEVFAYNDALEAVSVSIEHSSITDKSTYNEFGLDGYGFMKISAPEGYKITGADFYIYGKYHDIEYYKDEFDASISANRLTENSNTYGGGFIDHVNLNSDKLYAYNNNSHDKSLYYIVLYLQKGSFETASLDSETFAVNSTHTSVKTDVLDGTANVEFYHSAIVDASSLGAFALPENGYMAVIAPEGYKILKVLVQVPYEEDYLQFYNDCFEDEGDYYETGNLLENRISHYQESDFSEYEMKINNSRFIIKNARSGENVNIYRLTVILVKI